MLPKTRKARIALTSSKLSKEDALITKKTSLSTCARINFAKTKTILLAQYVICNHRAFRNCPNSTNSTLELVL